MSKFGEFFLHDWYIAWPMIAMSVIALALVIWRALLNHNGNTNLNEFLPRFQERLEREGVEGALRFCRTRSDIIPRRLFPAGLETSKQGLAAMRRAMANVIELEILPDLNFLLPSILAIAKIATMVGLLGTVISMINTFQDIQDAVEKGQRVQAAGEVRETAETGDVASHSGSIGLALFATALGLVTAIPLVFSHVLFRAWVTRFELKMKSAAQKLLVLVQAAKPGGQPARPGVIPTAKPAVDPSAIRR